MSTTTATLQDREPKSLQRDLRARRSALLVLGLFFAAATITYSVVWMYYIRWEPKAEIGLDTNAYLPSKHSMEVTRIYPGSPAEQAGIRVHDQIVAIDGQYLSAAGPEFLQTSWLHRQAGDVVRLTLRRPGKPETISVTPVFRAAPGHGSLKSVADQVIGSYPIVFLIIGLVVLFLRIEDRNAWLFAILCAGFIAASAIPSSAVAVKSGLRHFMFAYRAIFVGMLPCTFYVFFAFFPQRSPLDKLAPWLKWFIALIGIAVTLPGILLGRPEPWPAVARIAGVKAAYYGTLVYIYGTIALTLGSLCWTALTTSNPETKRKFRVIFWGTLAGVTPVATTRLVSDFAAIRVPFWVTFLDVVLLTLFPVAFAYAVVKHRVMEIPVLLRQSARYLLVRRGFVFLLLLLALLVNALFAITLSRALKLNPALAISIGGAFGIALAWISAPGVRRSAERIDRAFFRESYDARVILQDLARSIRTVTSRGQLPELIEKEFAQALHPVSLAVYLRDAQGDLQPPPHQPSLSAIHVRSPEPNLLFRMKDPTAVSANGSSASVIPELRPLNPACLVPVLSRSEDLLGLIVLGAKRSEEPYSAEDKRLLGSVASQAGLVLESIDLAEQIAKRIDSDRRVQHELQIARAVQAKLLPQHAPPLASLDYAGACIQARTVGGDYYDFLELGPSRVGFVLADIAGKGISGALLMANLQASLRSRYSAADRDLPQFLRSVNHLFVENTETTHYATVFFGIYDDETRRLKYVNCGHNPPLLLRSRGDIERLEATATVLGLFEPWDCSVAEVELFPKDILAIYTDGITEACNKNEEEFGEDRLIGLLKANSSSRASDLLKVILSSVQAFSPGEQSDDLTVIAAICR